MMYLPANKQTFQVTARALCLTGNLLKNAHD